MSQENRSQTMARKLAAYAQRAGVKHEEPLHAYQLAVELRMAQLRDVFHPDLLHPARTALVLLEDAGVRDPLLLTAGVLAETEFERLRVPEAAIRAQFSDRIVDLVKSVPKPAEAGELLLEQLLDVSEGVALIALAERLDHARHLHFRDSELWPAFHSQITTVYLPFASRTNEPLTFRFARWSAAFQRRFLLTA